MKLNEFCVIILHHGKIAEMATVEGKTLVSHYLKFLFYWWGGENTSLLLMIIYQGEII